MDLQVLLQPTVNLERMTEVLDGLGHAGRVATVRGWERKDLARLFEACKGHHPLTLEHFVPSSIGPMTEVIHHGKNSLPMFTRFQKRFTRPEGDAGATELWGFNRQANEGFTGPGYFVVHASFDASKRDGAPGESASTNGEVAIDYRRVPGGKVAAWPEVIPNAAKLGRFVYAGMVDVMRGVSSHVSIGRAWKDGQWMDAWFALCREDVS